MDSINAPIHYSFLSGNPPNYRDFFEINPNTGAVKQIRAVDTTVTKKFDIIIKVNIAYSFLLYLRKNCFNLLYLFIFYFTHEYCVKECVIKNKKFEIIVVYIVTNK